MHCDVVETGEWLSIVLNGWLNYYAVPSSYQSLNRFANRLKRLWLSILRRRSQNDRNTWDSLNRYLARYWPRVTIRHPWPY